MTSISPARLAGTSLLVAWGLAFSLACRLIPATTLDPRMDPGIVSLILGESRQVLAVNLFNEADLYFHKGVGHLQNKVATRSVFQHWQNILAPEQHAHTEGLGSAEILPWLKLAIQADPRHVEAYLVAAFWAETGIGRADLAEGILSEAQRANPSDYRIPLERGRLFIRTGRLDASQESLFAALQFQSRSRADATTDLQFSLDQAEIHTFLGFLHEVNNRRTDAIRFFNNALAIFPERTYIKDRIVVLTEGREPPIAARSLLEKLTRQRVHDACHDDHDHEKN